MTKEQALSLIAQALASVKATLQDHQALQEALKTLVDDVKKDETEDK